jgi:hypothetical protein
MAEDLHCRVLRIRGGLGIEQGVWVLCHFNSKAFPPVQMLPVISNSELTFRTGGSISDVACYVLATYKPW